MINLTGFSKIQPEFFAMRNFLKKIVITHAKLNVFPDFQSCPLLETLDLSFNAIAEVPVLTRSFPKLFHFCISSNRIESLGSLVNISNLAVLRELDIRFNPVCNRRGFKLFLTRKIPSLMLFNCEHVYSNSKDSLYLESNWEALLIANSSDQVECFRPMSIRTISGLESSALEKNYYPSQVILNPSVQGLFSADAITTLELDSCQLLNLNRLPERLVVDWRMRLFKTNPFLSLDVVWQT